LATHAITGQTIKAFDFVRSTKKLECSHLDGSFQLADCGRGGMDCAVSLFEQRSRAGEPDLA